MVRSFDLSVLRAFVTAADCGSITAAANALNLTQGAVSQQVRRLEADLGESVFDRDRSGVRLTADGERLLGKARQLLALNDQIWAEMAPEPVGGRVRLGVPFDLASTCIERVLKRYAARHPSIELSLICSSSPDLLAAACKNEVDLAVVEEPAGRSAGEALGIERLVWVGARGGLAHTRDPLPVSIADETCAFRPAILAALRDQNRRWRTVFENRGLEATMSSVRADLAVAVSLESLAPPDVSILGRDIGLPELPPFSVNLHFPPVRTARAVEEMARELREQLRRPSSEVLAGHGNNLTSGHRHTLGTRQR